MQKYPAPKLLEALLMPPRKPALRVIFSDDAIYRRLALDSFVKLNVGAPKVYSGKTAVADCVNDAAAGSLFAPPAPAVVDLEAKLTAKQWEVDLKSVSRLPSVLEAPIYLFAPIALRNVIKSEKFPGECIICWSPDVGEARRGVAVLAKRYPKLAQIASNIFENYTNLALDYYSSDLMAIDLHFERMERSGVDFEGAFMGQTGTNAFHVVDALAQGDAMLLELKMQQCVVAGEDPAPILKAVSAFLRQLAQVFAALERTAHLAAVLDNLNIRVPAQKKRFEMAVARFTPAQVAQFFWVAPDLEMQLRSHPMPHDLLSTELMGLLGVTKK